MVAISKYRVEVNKRLMNILSSETPNYPHIMQNLYLKVARKIKMITKK